MRIILLLFKLCLFLCVYWCLILLWWQWPVPSTGQQSTHLSLNTVTPLSSTSLIPTPLQRMILRSWTLHGCPFQWSPTNELWGLARAVWPNLASIPLGRNRCMRPMGLCIALNYCPAVWSQGYNHRCERASQSLARLRSVSTPRSAYCWFALCALWNA